MGNQCGAHCSQAQADLKVKYEEEKKLNKKLRVEMIKCLDCLTKQPDLSKYQHKINDNQDNVSNMQALLASKKFGGSVLVKRLEGKKNPLKNQIDSGSESFGPRFQKVLSKVVPNGEKMFNLENIQLKKGFPEFMDA